MPMLTIKCAACKRKLWKYEKIGKGAVLRCYKDRMTRHYAVQFDGVSVQCPCGKVIGVDEGAYIKMIASAFTYSGTKETG